MKTALQILLFAFLIIFLSCAKLKNETKTVSEKETLLVASQKFTDLDKTERTLKIYKDSSYVFIENIEEPTHKKLETYEGKLEIKNDTIKFPLLLKYNRCENAVLKNGFLEFIDGEYPDRMKIEKTSLSVKNYFDLNKFQNYAVFTFYKNFHKQSWETNYSNYDLNTEQIKKIDEIYASEFLKNKRLKNYKNYLKQITAVKNEKNEVIILTHFFCKDSHILESFQYYEISMMDGGICNIYSELNLTTGKITTFNIAGFA